MRSLLMVLMLALPAPVFANHPSEDLNPVMAEKEAAFEPLDPRLAPDLALADASGGALGLADFAGQIVALSFVPAGCGAPCTQQQERLADTLASLNASPMREMVRFVTVTDNAEVAGIDMFENWTLARPASSQTAQDLGDAFGGRTERPDAAPMIHLIDRQGRQVGIFHGDSFLPLNLVLYINGLTNAHPPPVGPLEQLLGWFR
jgi:protein SCO1/2